MKVRNIHKNSKSPFRYEMRLQVLIYKAYDKADEEERKNPSVGEGLVHAPEFGGWIPVSEFNRLTCRHLGENAHCG